MREKSILGEAFAMAATAGRVSLSGLARRLQEDPASLVRDVAKLKTRGLLEGSASSLRLTPKGRSRIRVVFIGGGFEVIHPGHLHTVSQAKSLGDVLVVIVARDSTIKKRKGREPISNEEERLALVSSLRPVDAAILGVQGNIYETLEKVKPDVVALGYDQYHQESEIRRESRRRGLKLEVVRLRPAGIETKTSKIIEKLS